MVRRVGGAHADELLDVGLELGFLLDNLSLQEGGNEASA